MTLSAPSMLIGTRDIMCTNVSSAIWLIDDFSKKKPLGPIQVSIKKKFLFEWNSIHGSHDERLKQFLNQDFGIEWVLEAKILKIEDDRTIKVYDEANGEYTILLQLNEEKTRVALKFYDNRTVGLIARKQNGQLNIFSERDIKPVKNLTGYYVFKNIPPGTYIVEIQPELYFNDKRKVCILKFDSIGPEDGVNKVILDDVSELEDEDKIEFRNPSGDVEKRVINTNLPRREISWDDELKFDFSEKGSTVLASKYLDVEINLRPRPIYPFSSSATLVRGLVFNQYPVADAIVQDVTNSIVSKTDTNGEFVHYYKGIEDGTIIDINIIKNSDSIQLSDITITPGNTIYLGKIFFRDR